MMNRLILSLVVSAVCIHGQVAVAGEDTPVGGSSSLPWVPIALVIVVAGAGIAGLIVWNITLRRKLAELQRQLQQVNRMDAVGQLAGGIAHDFNNILASILGFADVLQLEASVEQPTREAAERIAQAAEKGSLLTRQLLGLARSEKTSIVPVAIHDIIREVRDLLVSTIHKNIAITLKLADETLVVLGNAGQLHQVLLNLAINARDAMPNGGEITISTEAVYLDEDYCAKHPGDHPGPHVLLSVADTGHGIPEDVRPRIFEPFFTTKSKEKGTGMGLAMVYSIVKNHGGTVRVQSTKDTGTVFNIYLPRSTDEAPAAETEPATEEVEIPGTVLVVDDEEIPLNAAAGALEKLGARVAAVSSGSGAVEYFKEHHSEVSLVIVDTVMPEMDGAECFAALKDIDPDVKTIVVAPYDLDNKIQQVVGAGVRGVVEKPYRAETMAGTIDNALKGGP